MAAYAAVVSLEQTIVKSLDNGPYSISVVERDQMICIREYLISLEAFLKDFPDKATGLEVRIRDIANAAEDALESFLLEQIQSGQRESAEHSQQTGCKYMCFGRADRGSITKKHEFQKELKKAKKSFRRVTKLAMDLKKIRITEKQEQPHCDSSTASPSSMIRLKGKTQMIGFQDDLQQIRNQVFGESSKRQVIPIVGMGGIGKTTLARSIYDDSWTIEHFQIRVWVTVSQDYRKEQVLGQMKEVLRKNLPDMDESLLNSECMSSEEAIYKSMKGRRYLIVMDDIWNREVWDDLRQLLPDDRNSSRIMLTTRILDVATYVRSDNPPHEMQLMDNDQSWNLLRQLVFPGESCPPYLEKDGMIIARNCRGLPLAIVVMAGVLSKISKAQTSWKNVTEDVIQAAMANDDQFATTLVSLSYNHLPQHLRQCFLYMGCFPEDYEIYASNLVKLWVGEGFLKPSGSMSREEWAKECLNDLVRRNLVLVIKKTSFGKIKTCGLHDLVRDSCIKKAREEMFFLHMTNWVQEKSMKGIRRVCVSTSNSPWFEEKYSSAIRSIILDDSVLSSLPKLRLVRVLHVVNMLRGPALDEVVKLFHLRYLAYDLLSWASLMTPLKIPSTISNLMNLQIIIINPKQKERFSEYVVCWPLEFWRMTQLRHLESYSFAFIADPEGATPVLTNLETLSRARNFVWSERVVKMIPNLKKLGLSYRRTTESDQDYELGNLIYLHQLEILELNMYHSFWTEDTLNTAFPMSLKKLTLSNWILPWSDMAIIGLLPNLEILKLVRVTQFISHDNYSNTWETNEGEFLQLKFLLLENTHLKHWVTESSHFPCLQSLLLHQCWLLREIPDVIAEIPTLELLEVDGGNEHVMQSAKQIQEEQQENGNNTLRVLIKRR